MRHRHDEPLGPWHIGILAVLFTMGLLFSSASQSHGQDYWSSVFPAKPQWSQQTSSVDPYRPTRDAGFRGTDPSRREFSPDRRSDNRNPALLRKLTDTMMTSPELRTVPGFFDGLNDGLQADNRYNPEFVRLGSWHQLLDLQHQFTRTDHLLFNVLAREADRQQASDARMFTLLQEWDKEEAQSRKDWERECPGQAAWVRDYVQWYGPDSIEALTTKLQAVTDCPPGI